MSQHSYLKIGNGWFYLENTTPTYFGLQKGCLDIHTMRYRIFGAVWKIANGRKYVLGYWFAEHENDIKRAKQEAGFSDAIKSKKMRLMKYTSLSERIKNKKTGLKERCYMSFRSRKDFRKGWYVLKSSTDFPMILTCIQKKRYSEWIEHIKVCETEADIKNFLNLINLEHNINLSPPEITMH